MKQDRIELLDRIDRRPLLTAAEEAELVRRIRAGDKAEERELAERNLGLAAKWARKHARHSSLDVDDLFQAGVVGLMTAIKRFDPARGVRFSTYATWWIRSELGVLRKKHWRHQGFGGSTDRLDELVDDTTNPDPDAPTIEDLQLDSLDPLRRKIVLLHFGIGERRARTVEEIGKKLQLHPTMAKQLLDEGLRQLRDGVEDRRELLAAA